ncbi:hypothetical protein Poli38472_004550 [Pythium oligandrum]|uniref:Trichohyalin-plectin-homology domain-containing protein n=1 Tax=Pythium oligandrum TaxID=41045 RepID=A0A8K1CA46_PYTOL|nr:hypothetical protein Poli38472_004550 [Pythium oligandrum]|eukprot:TMW59481.1 hypothetical protein Poli38472_004550 [Pythium oligandrum]
MAGKSTQRSAVKGSDTQSIMSMTSVRTVDREKLRDKARQMQMRDNLRLMLCARIQQTLKKSPKVAEELAGAVLRAQQQRGLGMELSDDELRRTVEEICGRRQEQKHIAASARNDPDETLRGNQHQIALDKRSGRRSSSGTKDSSARSHGSGEGASGRRGTKSSSKNRIKESEASPTADEDNVYMTQSQLQQLSTGFRLPPKVSPKKEKGNGIWEEIVKFSSVEEQLEAERRTAAKENARHFISSKLEEQVHDRRQQLEAQRKAAQEEHERTIARVRAQEEEERAKERKRLEMAQQLTQIQTEQRRVKAQQQERERQAKKAQEIKMAETLRKQMEDERARDQARKETEKQRIMRVLQDNQEELRRKQQLKEQERDLEVKLAEDYVKMEESKEAARRKHLEDMAANVKARMKFFGDTAKADMDAKAREEEQRVLKYQEEYARQQAEAERKKKEEAERRNQQQQEQLRQQMQEKRAREAAVKTDLNKQAELWRQERIEAERKEKLMQQQRAMRNHSQQDVLKQQIREKETRSLEADQSLLEVQLNAKLLEKIHKQVGNGASVVSETQNRSREVRTYHINSAIDWCPNSAISDAHQPAPAARADFPTDTPSVQTIVLVLHAHALYI